MRQGYLVIVKKKKMVMKPEMLPASKLLTIVPQLKQDLLQSTKFHSYHLRRSKLCHLNKAITWGGPSFVNKETC